MKRIAYSFFLLLALPVANGFAQGRFMWGITGGVNTGYRYEIPDPAFPNSEPSYRTGWAPGLHAGIELGYYNWNAICVTFGLEYNQRNYRDNYGYIEGDEFLEIPVLLKVPVIGNNPRLYLLAGPNFGVHDPIDVGIAGGVGIITALSSRTDFYIQTEYVYGFNELVYPVYTYDLAPGAKPFAVYTNYSREVRLQLGILFGK
jgi:hypothetical protein